MNFKPLMFLALVLGLSSGCATFTPERRVMDYTLTSNDPSLAIAVSPSFEYLGNIKDQRTVKSTRPGYDLRVDSDAHVFVIREPGKPRIEKILSVQFDKIESNWGSDIFGRSETMLESGTLTLGNESFQYCTLFIYPVASASAYVTRFLQDKGFILPPGLTKTAARIYGNRGDSKMTISYLEVVGSGHLSKMNWRTPGDLTSVQKEYLGKFNERFLAAFKVLQPNEVPKKLPLIESQRIEEGDFNAELEEFLGFKDAVSTTEEKPQERTVKAQFEGLWGGEAKCDSSTGLGGFQCRAGQIAFRVKGNVLRGLITDQLGYKYKASGSVDENGRVKAGVVATQTNFATYTGVLAGNVGSGIWQDKYECYGTWTANKRGD